MRALLAIAAALLMAGLACDTPAPPGTTIPLPDYARFVEEVEPSLVEGCGFADCHGAAARPMKLYSPSATRLKEGLIADELSDEEHRANYDRVRVFAAPTSAELPDLLRKPLQKSEGGAFHGGVDRFGNNVYPSKQDPRWRLLQDWLGTLATDAGQDGDAGELDGGASVGDGGVGCAGCGVSFERDLKPFLNTLSEATCGGAKCHGSDSDAGCGYSLESVTELMGAGCDARPNLKACESWSCEPGKPVDIRMRVNNRLLYYACTGHQGRFSNSQAQLLARWVRCGAQP